MTDAVDRVKDLREAAERIIATRGTWTFEDGTVVARALLNAYDTIEQLVKTAEAARAVLALEYPKGGEDHHVAPRVSAAWKRLRRDLARFDFEADSS